MPVVANVINVAERTDRWEKFTNDWKDKTTIKIERQDAFKPDGTEIKDVYEAVFLKHREILTKAKERGEKYCLIMEDDAIPCKDFDERFEAIYEYLENHPEEWDCFNGGMLKIHESIQSVIRLTHKSGLNPPTLLIKTNRGCMAHFVILKVDSVLEKTKCWEEEGKPLFDGWYTSKLNCLASVPYLAQQSDGKSDVSGEHREWVDQFRFEEEAMLYYLRTFIYYPSQPPESLTAPLPLEER